MARLAKGTGRILLHEAMARVSRQAGRPLTAREIVERIEKRGLYCKRDGSQLETNQIYARVRKYPQLFKTEGQRPKRFTAL